MTDLRPLGEIMEVLEQVGLKISYAYDDLLFVEQNPFLLRFDEKNSRLLYFYANTELVTEMHDQLLEKVSQQFVKIKCIIEDRGTFDLSESESEKESLDIAFYDKEDLP